MELPPSKSIAARALTIAYLAGSRTAVDPLPDSDDINILRNALSDLCGDEGVEECRIFCGASGTAIRFLTAAVALRATGPVVLTGIDRLCHRPIAPLVDALRSLGAEIEYEGEEGFPPLKIHPSRLSGGEVRLRADISSQYISALMMIAPLLPYSLVIRLEGRAVSAPYVRMTAAVMHDFGADAVMEQGRITVSCCGYRPPEDYFVEPDFSAAAFFLEAALINPSYRPHFKDLPDPAVSVQGDSLCFPIFAAAERAKRTGSVLEADMSSTPDLVPPLAVGAALAGIPFHLSGISSLRIKESDRIRAIIDGLAAFGVTATTTADTLSCMADHAIPRSGKPVRICSCGDHRIAMAFAPGAFLRPVDIDDPATVAKSFPDFFNQLTATGIIIKE